MSARDILKNGGILLVPGQHIVELQEDARLSSLERERHIQCPPRYPQSFHHRNERFTLKFSTDDEGLQVFQNMGHLMQDYVLYYNPDLMYDTIMRSAHALQPNELKILHEKVKRAQVEIEKKILTES